MSKKLHFAVLEYLQKFAEEGRAKGTLDEDSSESVDVAVQCLSTVWGLDLEDEPTKKSLSIKPLTLDAVFAVGQKSVMDAVAKAKATQGTPSTSAGDVALGPEHAKKFEKYIQFLESKGYFQSAAKGSPEYDVLVQKAKQKFVAKYNIGAGTSSAPAPQQQQQQEPQQEQQQKEAPKPSIPENETEEEKAARIAKANELKGLGNTALAAGDHAEAVKKYTEALALHESHIYYSNRAAANTHLKKYDDAVADCQKSIALDPTYIKAYSRLGLAFFCQKKYTESLQAYEDGLKQDPSNTACTEGVAKCKQAMAAPAMPNLGDLASNPEVMDQVQGFMNSGMGQQMMNNPMVQQMMQNFAQDPSQLSQMMNNPEIMNMAQQMFSGGGGGGGGNPFGGMNPESQ